MYGELVHQAGIYYGCTDDNLDTVFEMVVLV